jgi:hypothetical protein
LVLEGWTSAQWIASGDAIVLSGTEVQYWKYDDTSTEAADSRYIVPTDTPAMGRGVYQGDYETLIAMYNNMSGGGEGSVSKVGFQADQTDIFSVSGSPITTSGVISLTMLAQNANTILAGPTSGSGTVPSFRSLVSDDIPDLSIEYDTAGSADAALTEAKAYTDGVIPSSANPSATAGPIAINGSATSFMRSDAAPAIRLATTSQTGLVKPDGTSITIDGDGKIHSVVDTTIFTELAFALDFLGR